MSTFTLKIIACLTMLIDHITAIFIPQNTGLLFHLSLFGFEKDITWYVIGRVIGRISFPIFAFLIVEGFFHTKNLKKYIARLAIFAVISEIPYDFAFWDFPNTAFMFFRQNIMLTLLLGLLTITFLDAIHRNFMDQPIFMNVFMTAVVVAGALTLVFLNGSYQELGYGVLLIVLFYMFHGRKKPMIIAFILLVGFMRGDIEFMAILAAPILYCYNGEKGRSVKYLFYWFYPVHLVVLQGIYLLMQRG